MGAIIKVSITRTGPTSLLITWDGEKPGHRYISRNKLWIFRKYNEKETRKLSVIGNTVILEDGDELKKALKAALS
jgi:hypothetical protein